MGLFSDTQRGTHALISDNVGGTTMPKLGIFSQLRASTFIDIGEGTMTTVERSAPGEMVSAGQGQIAELEANITDLHLYRN